MLFDLKRRVLRRLERRRYAPAIKVEPSPRLIRLGSEYGGWTFELSPDLKHSVIISCGLGEDGSFDVEFAARFGAKVIIVDPTPRAIRHFNEIYGRIGQPAATGYAKGGKQSVVSYDLRIINEESLVLEPFALWVENTRLKFFAPSDPNHVSHSIVDYQNNYSQNGSYIEVESITLEELQAKHHLTALPLIKLDVEGAEVNVIRQMLDKAVHPRQILVEFDEMGNPSPRSKQNVEDVDRQLRQAGYLCRYFDGQANFLYALRSQRSN
jgi:FkbM family methyltransferase